MRNNNVKQVYNHMYIIMTVLLAVSSQMIIKWQVSKHSTQDIISFNEKIYFALGMLVNPYVILSIILTFLSGLSWIIAMTKFEISYAYPFTALGFVLILLFSSLFFQESITYSKITGIIFIVAGIIIIGRNL